MNILAAISLDQLLLIGIFVVLILIWLRLPKQENAYKRRQRQHKINKIKSFIFRKEYE